MLLVKILPCSATLASASETCVYTITQKRMFISPLWQVPKNQGTHIFSISSCCPHKDGCCQRRVVGGVQEVGRRIRIHNVQVSIDSIGRLFFPLRRSSVYSCLYHLIASDRTNKFEPSHNSYASSCQYGDIDLLHCLTRGSLKLLGIFRKPVRRQYSPLHLASGER